MEAQNSDQAEILERVRHLNGETGAITDIFSTNHSLRMNFGVPQGPQEKCVKSSLQSLATEERSSNTEGASIARHPPGFCENPVLLGTSSQAPQINTNQLLIPTLGARGSSLLSSTPAPSGFGLTGLSLQGLAGGPSSGSGCQKSLSSLASSHLASTAVQSSLSSPSLSLPAPSPSLSNLASSHLGLAGGGSQGATFTIPTIFGEKKEERDSVSTPVRSSAQPEINLMSALKLNSDPEITNMKAETRSPKVEENILNINILVPHNSFDSIKSILRKRTKTPFSFALTRKFTRKDQKPKLKIHSLPEHRIKIFRFDSLSPDDIVLKAQKQSRGFTR
jgi:hypothetical protein